MSITDQINKMLGRSGSTSKTSADAGSMDASSVAASALERTQSLESEQLSTADFGESRDVQPPAPEAVGDGTDDAVSLPILGRHSAAQHQRVLSAVLGVSQ